MIGNTPVADPGEWPGGRRPPLFLDQIEARRAEKNFAGDRSSPYLRVWMTAPPPPLSQGLDPALHTVLFSPSGRDILCLSHVPKPVSPLPVPLGTKP